MMSSIKKLSFFALFSYFFAPNLVANDLPSGIVIPGIEQEEPGRSDNRITPQTLQVLWTSGNQLRLAAEQASRLNPVSSKMLYRQAALYVNYTADRYDVYTEQFGEERAELVGSHLWWYGENLFVDSGSYTLKLSRTVDFEEKEERFGYGRTTLGARFSPVNNLHVVIAASRYTTPEISDGSFTGAEEKEWRPFFSISGYGFSYSRDQSNDDESFELTSYYYRHDDIGYYVSFLRGESNTADLDNEYEISIDFPWRETQIDFWRSGFVNSNSENWSVGVVADRLSLRTILFDSESDTRESKFGFGLDYDLIGLWGKAQNLAKRNAEMKLGVHYNNIKDHILTTPDKPVLSLRVGFKY